MSEIKPAEVLGRIAIGPAIQDARRSIVAEGRKLSASKRMQKRQAELRKAEAEDIKLKKESRDIMATELKKNGGEHLKVPMVSGRMARIMETVRPFLPSIDGAKQPIES